jgi:hypothetical protein
MLQGQTCWIIWSVHKLRRNLSVVITVPEPQLLSDVNEIDTESSSTMYLRLRTQRSERKEAPARSQLSDVNVIKPRC